MANSPTEEPRTLELLEATPRAGVRPDTSLADLLRLGETMAQPAAAARTNRPPTAGDLALVSLPGKPPMFVLEVRGNKLELVDFSKSDSKLVILTDRAEVLDPWHASLAERIA